VIRTTVLVLDQGLASTFVGPLEVLRHAGVIWNRLTDTAPRPTFEVVTAAAGTGPVACDGGFAVHASTTIDAVPETDLVLVPSTGLDRPHALSRNAPLLPWLRTVHRRGAVIAGVCSGVELLAAAGLLDGRSATTHWGLAEDLRAAYPAVRWTPERMVTDDGGVVCSAGMYACLDLALHLVERFCGRTVALQTAQAFLIEPVRAGQAAFQAAGPRPLHDDPAIAQAEQWLRTEYARALRIDDLSARCAMSPRNFARRFRAATGQTPLEYLQQLRIRAARTLLESGSGTVQDVSLAVGYDDLAFFRQLFRRHTGSTPQEYRRRFGRQPQA
jgi:transcriptional regulator GlxA family with amidase domain